MNIPKAIFFDLDGTMLSQGKLPERAKMALKYAKDKGVLLFLATGRHKSAFEEMPWMPDVAFDGFVTLNGAYCYVGEKVLHKSAINSDAVSMVADYVIKNPQLCLFCEEDDQYAIASDEKIEAAMEAFGMKKPQLCSPLRAIDAAVFQIITFGKELSGVFRQLPGCTFTSWAEGCYDLVAADVNKWAGILPVLDHFGLKPWDVAAIGDGHNDIEMLTNAGYSIAMGNAPDDVKACADYVTGHVDEDGLWGAIRRLV